MLALEKIRQVGDATVIAKVKQSVPVVSAREDDDSVNEVKGIVKKFENGWGFIWSRDIDGRIFVHNSEIESTPKNLVIGDTVTFILDKNDQGYVARNVRRDRE